MKLFGLLLLSIPSFQHHVVMSFGVERKKSLSYSPFFSDSARSMGTNRRTRIKTQLSMSKVAVEKYDLAVVGAGPVGVQAAMLASSAPFHKKVCVIDAPRASGALMDEETETDLSIGGPTGLFSKALRDTSKRITVSTLRGMGLREDSIWNEIVNACVDLAQSNADDVRRQLEMVGVDLIEGFAFFPDSDTTESLYVTKSDSSTETIKADKILIATGSRPFRPSGIPFDGKRVFDSDTINTLSYLPKSIAITGSGIIAIEFAKIFRNLGADVTLIIRDRVPRNALMKIGLDKDVAAVLVADLIRSGIKIQRGAQVTYFDLDSNNRTPISIGLEGKDGAPLSADQPEEIKVDAYLAAVGRQPTTDNLNLVRAGIELDNFGGILVDSSLATTSRAGNVFAAGDVLGRPFLASTGVAQGIAAVSSMFRTPEQNPSVVTSCSTEYDADEEESMKSPIDYLCIDGDISQAGASFDPKALAANPFAFPTGVWTSPEAAYYGLSRQQAEEMGIDANEAIALYAECLRGRVFSPNGLLKLVFEKPAGRILGVHICGEDACELIHYGMELVKAKRTINDLNNSLYSAVTFHEMYRIAAVAALDEAGARKRRAAAGAAVAKRNRARVVRSAINNE